MQVSVFGLGYVGSVSAAALAADGHQVVGVDVHQGKVDAINQGRFRKFSVNLRFADTKLNASKLEVTIDMNSLDTGDAERDKILRGPELFDVARFAQAQYKSIKINRVSAGRYEAVGKLTIRDVTREVHVPFAFRTAAEQGAPVGYMTGRVTINRVDFGVGQGEWQATDQVANEVVVSFGLRLVAVAAPK